MRTEHLVDSLQVAEAAGRIRFLCVSPDSFGAWSLCYDRGPTRCRRPIVDDAGKRISWKDRRPLGRELLGAAAAVLGRPATRQEEDSLLTIKVIQ